MKVKVEFKVFYKCHRVEEQCFWKFEVRAIKPELLISCMHQRPVWLFTSSLPSHWPVSSVTDQASLSERASPGLALKAQHPGNLFSSGDSGTAGHPNESFRQNPTLLI